ncbi:hypothetical protein Tco_0681738 [Tanacetum coccineum]|uniref:Uncharacterized protein n=1 Tax=Tanacetum coccineum TaxID=301880 RepID=A0ABQ4XP60_9ASTR
MEDTLSKFMSESAKRHKENSNLIKKIQASTDVAIRNQRASIKTLEIQIGQMSKVLQERGFRSLPSSTEANPRDQVKSISTIIEADSYLIRRIRSSQYAKDYFKVGKIRINFKGDKRASSFNKEDLRNMLSLRERMELDLEARLMGETLVLNRSLDPFFEDYIELNDLNEPFELRRNQGDDLIPTIEEGEVIEEFRTRDDELDAGIDDYPSYCDYDKKIYIDCAHNLKFSCMIGFEFYHANFFPLLYVNVMSKKFHNSIMKDKMVYKGNNVIGALMNVPIFVGTFSVVTDFVVLENMDDYRDEGMGDDPTTFEMGGRKNASHASTLACMRWNEEKLKKRPRERNIDEYWWRIYKSGDLEFCALNIKAGVHTSNDGDEVAVEMMVTMVLWWFGGAASGGDDHGDVRVAVAVA